MKIIILICILLTVFAVQVKEKQNQNQSNGAITNKYKDLKNPFGNHSLFTGHNGDNISAAINAVPPPQPEK